MPFPRIMDEHDVTDVIVVGQSAYEVPVKVANYIKDFRNNCIIYMNALHHAASSCHHPACECKGERLSFPERYCTCHVQKAKKALELLEKQR